jgi:hypothetical protein
MAEHFYHFPQLLHQGQLHIQIYNMSNNFMIWLCLMLIIPIQQLRINNQIFQMFVVFFQL